MAKLVMRAAGDQAKMACVNLQLCAGLEAGIDGATHTVGQHQLERVRGRGSEEAEESADNEEDSENVEGLLNNLSKETTGTEEKVAERLEAALQMEADRDGERDSKGKEGFVGTLRALIALEFLTQDS